MDETWTIAELAERATTALAGLAPANGRVRDVPNERLIRYYTTIGLLDPPLARRGRIALYGRRHLLQLVAVKRRQAEGVSIAAIQGELVGATNTRLAELAGATLPTTPDAVSSRQTAGRPTPAGTGPRDSAPEKGPARDRRPDPAEPRPRFWADRPATAAQPGAATAPPDRVPGPVSSPASGPAPRPDSSPAPGWASDHAPAPLPDPVSGHARGPGSSPAPGLDSNYVPGSSPESGPDSGPVPTPPPAFPLAFHGVSLTPAAALLLTRPLSDDERAAVARAARPLIDLLTDLGLSEGMPS
ncbi:helix-turn-helix domain-containing protein [Herbidospora cretacea]|uniref:helix-turn-helix domain-containing protein n=1 Tax=Herbidospora cretacea TaxID=28444 RepID=UPI000773FEE6|nr:helix-turn-helix domain-containing protein [Herbidospora cretacea]